MKKIAVFLLLFLLALPLPCAKAEATIENVLDGLDTKALEDMFNATAGSAKSFRETVLKIARGEMTLSAQALLKTLSEQFLSALSGLLSRLPLLMVPTILCGTVTHLGDNQKSVGQITYIACFLLLAGVLAKDLSAYMRLCTTTIDSMASAMQTLFPLLLTLLAAVGATTSAFFGPAVVFASGTMTTVIQQVTLRCALIASLLSILSSLSQNMRITRLTSLFKQVANWTMGVSFTVFIGITTLKGMGASVYDGVTMRTAKYAVDNFVPVVGGMFADTMDTLVGCSLMIKNALGLTGMLMLLSISLSPIVQTAAGVMLFRGAAALLEPVGDERLVGLMHTFSESLMLLLIVLLSVFAMFILLTAQLLYVGSKTVGFL